MTDYISANLPAIDFDQTREFYTFLGFETVYQSAEWMIIEKVPLLLEFFHHPQLDPKTSCFSACIRTHAMQHLYEVWSALNWSLYPQARITEIQYLDEIDMFCVIDPNGSLIRCIQI